MQPHLDMVDRTSVEAQFDVAKTYVAKFNGDKKTQPTTTKLLSKHCEALKAMPTVHPALKLRVTLTAKCGNSFCSKNYHAKSQAIDKARLQSLSSPTCV